IDESQKILEFMQIKNISGIDAENCNSETPLHLLLASHRRTTRVSTALRLSLMNRMIEMGATLQKAIFGAVRSNSVEMLNYFQAKGMDFQVCNKFQETVLNVAVRKCSLEVVQLLLSLNCHRCMTSENCWKALNDCWRRTSTERSERQRETDAIRCIENRLG